MPMIEQEAKMLAAENYKADPDTARIYWFRDDREIRLLELSDRVPAEQDGIIHPFYFNPSPQDGLSFPSAVAVIRQEEFGKLELPEGWGDWKDAVEVRRSA